MYDEYRLDASQREDMLKRYYEGEVSLRDRLIPSFYPLILHIIKREFKYIDQNYIDDMISSGFVGVIKALDNYNPSYGYRFSTFASKCIYNQIAMMFRREKKYLETESLNHEVFDDNENIIFMELLTDDSAHPEEYVEEKDIYLTALKLIKNLPEKQREIIRLRYLTNNPLRQIEVAKRLKTTQCNISRLENKALNKIREAVLA